MSTDENLTAATGDEASLIIGQIRAPEGLQKALQKILDGVALESAVLLVFSKDTKGRLGVFENRIITGASLEPSGDTGIEAVQAILAVTHGMYGFRPALGDEARELSQSLTISLVELLKSDPQHISTAASSSAPIQDQLSPEQAEQAKKDAEGTVITDQGEIDPGYLRWLQSERDKVLQDIEQTITKAGQTPAASSGSQTQAQEAEAVSNLRLVSEMLQSEQHRADRWQGLDAIPTPSVVSQNAYAGVDRRSAVTGQQSLPPEGDRRSGQLPLQASTKITSASALKATVKVNRQAAAGIDDPAAQEVSTESADLGGIVKRRQLRLTLSAVAVVLSCGFIAHFFHAYEIRTALTDANRYFAKKEYLQAAIVAEQAIKQDPNNPRLHLQLGLALAKMRRFNKAILEFDTCLRQGGPRLPALLGRAGAFCEKKEYDKAIAECKAILLNNPDSTEAILILAAAHEHQNQPERAAEICTTGLSKIKDQDARNRLLIERGFAYRRLLKPQEAEADFTAALDLKPTAVIYIARGDLYRKTQKYPEATADYSKAIEMEPENYIPYVSRGICQAKQHHDEDALKDFGTALKLEKHCLEAFIQRGSLYLSQGAFRLAANDLEDAVKLNPRLAESQQKLDFAHKHLRREKQTVATNANEQQTKFILPTSLDELLNVGMKYLNDGEIDHAILCFTAAVKQNPNCPEGRQHLAHALFAAGDADGAAKNFEALNTINGIDPADVLPMASSLARSGKRNRAIQVLETWLAQAPNVVLYRCELANLYFAAKMPGKAKMTVMDGITLPSASTADKAKLQDLMASFSPESQKTPTKSAEEKNAESVSNQ